VRKAYGKMFRFGRGDEMERHHRRWVEPRDMVQVGMYSGCDVYSDGVRAVLVPKGSDTLGDVVKFEGEKSINETQTWICARVSAGPKMTPKGVEEFNVSLGMALINSGIFWWETQCLHVEYAIKPNRDITLTLFRTSRDTQTCQSLVLLRMEIFGGIVPKKPEILYVIEDDIVLRARVVNVIDLINNRVRWFMWGVI
jgi:hypothetical protein